MINYYYYILIILNNKENSKNPVTPVLIYVWPFWDESIVSPEKCRVRDIHRKLNWLTMEVCFIPLMVVIDFRSCCEDSRDVHFSACHGFLRLFSCISGCSADSWHSIWRHNGIILTYHSAEFAELSKFSLL